MENVVVSYEILMGFVIELSNNEGIVTACPCFCVDEKHHRNLNETPGEVQERPPRHSKGTV